MFRLTVLVIFSFLLAFVHCLSVEVNIKGPQKKACQGIITFVALDSDCSECLYGVKSFRYATVQCKTDAAALQCCKTVTQSWK
ncbi:uncharacterized protein BX664DRAFT_343078 [Halteromyces radiatus]|uniref:uncharacterized protein n=1 Tax=Halteromyces radiatus TaxID=101107 RepID=UPI002220A4AB|nr:uncharacterized protein BX664DRAFT_343078 [Halteromyces radiatus]KAI8078917.1 hypothetical protein BX664DRAFT_343078 [Halteromyces radiatus]